MSTAAWREGAYLLRSPATARRLLEAYENALNGRRLVEHELIDPELMAPSSPPDATPQLS